MKPRIVCITQARMTSTRLPGKSLMDLAGKPVISWHMERLKLSKLFDDCILTTSNDPSDDPLAQFAQNAGYKVFRGSLHDVLDRYYQCACIHEPDLIVRVTADSPMQDIRIIDDLCQKLLRAREFICANTHSMGLPAGNNCEIFTFHQLQQAANNAQEPHEREHVGPYIFGNCGPDKCLNLPPPDIPKQLPVDLGDMHWCIDTRQDWQFLEKFMPAVIKQHGHAYTMENAYQTLCETPQWLAISHELNDQT